MSVQSRKQKIKYLEQCVKELEEKCKDLVESRGRVRFCGEGLSDDDFITPYNNGEFDMILRNIK